MKIDPADPAKACRTCGSVLPRDAEHFARRRRSADGLLPHCRPCWSARALTRRAKDKDADRARHRKWYLARREAKAAEYRRKALAHYHANREQRRIERLSQPYVGSAADRQRRREYRQANRDLLSAWDRSRRAREHRAAGTASAEQTRQRVAYYGALCYICRAPWEAIDHVIPLARGGSNWPANLRPICRRCNSQKHTRTLAEFLAWRALSVSHRAEIARRRVRRHATARPDDATP